MTVKEIKRSTLQSLGNITVPALANVLAKTLEIKYINGASFEKIKSENKNFIAAFWHGKMFAGWFLFGGENSAALVSKSKDGEILSRALAKWGYEVIRGSSNAGGKEALALMEKALRSGRSLSITPDGPTGPREKMKAGTIVLAKKTGVPIILAGICYKKKRVFGSWDKFELPRFFSEVYVKFSEPFFVDENLTYEETNELILKTEKRLAELNKEAERECY